MARRWTEDEDAAIRDRGAATYADVARVLNRTYAAVKKRAERAGITGPVGRRPNARASVSVTTIWPASQHDDLVASQQEGEPMAATIRRNAGAGLADEKGRALILSLGWTND